MKFFTALLFILISSNTWSGIDCDYDFSLSNATVMLSENQQVLSQDIQITRGQNSPNGLCTQYFIFFGKGSANNYQRKAYSSGGKSINYNLHRYINLSGTLKDYNDALNSNEYVAGAAESKLTTYSNKFYVSLPGSESQDSPQSGIYTDSVQVRLYSFDNIRNEYRFEKSLNFTISISSNKKIQVSLIDEGEVFDPNSTMKVLDFGNLSQGQEQGVDLRVVSNTSYRISLSSLNNGKLNHSKGDTIEYSLKSNGSFFSMSSSSTSPVSIGNGNPTSTAGDRYNLRIRISGTIENKTAGLYQDIITITATAN